MLETHDRHDHGDNPRNAGTKTDTLDIRYAMR